MESDTSSYSGKASHTLESISLPSASPHVRPAHRAGHIQLVVVAGVADGQFPWTDAHNGA
jgi:hypothetical protein